jgi:hypothetical protein
MNNLQLEELFLPSFLYFSTDNCSIPSTEKLPGDAIQRLKPATSWPRGRESSVTVKKLSHPSHFLGSDFALIDLLFRH